MKGTVPRISLRLWTLKQFVIGRPGARSNGPARRALATHQEPRGTLASKARHIRKLIRLNLSIVKHLNTPPTSRPATRSPSGTTSFVRAPPCRAPSRVECRSTAADNKPGNMHDFWRGTVDVPWSLSLGLTMVHSVFPTSCPPLYCARRVTSPTVFRTNGTSLRQQVPHLLLVGNRSLIGDSSQVRLPLRVTFSVSFLEFGTLSAV